MVFGPCTPRDAEPSPHPLLIVLEPEAASFYCWEKAKHLDLKLNDQFLIADIGGGTTDIVVHAKASDGAELKVREVQASSGALCGGTNVDINFFKLLCREIGCFEDFVKGNGSVWLSLQSRWQRIKSTFDGERDMDHELELPSRLGRAWEVFDLNHNVEPRAMGYEDLSVTTGDIKKIFEPVVAEIIHLIDAKLTKRVKVLVIVGGFSASPYLMTRLTSYFRDKVQQIISPPEPGCAICHGAVMLGIASTSGIVSRISRKTYGCKVMREFTRGIDPIEHLETVDGVDKCNDVFSVFVGKGSEVEIDQRIKMSYFPSRHHQDSMKFQIYSCSRGVIPKFVTDEGVVCEGSFVVDMSESMEMDMGREVSLCMYFGRSAIEVTAQRVNFGNTSAVEALPILVPFDQS